MEKPETTEDQVVELKPCSHMTKLISGRADDSLSGPAKWYTDFHVLTCPSCKIALQGLKQVQEQVKEMSCAASPAELKLDAEDWKRIEEGWNREELEQK